MVTVLLSGHFLFVGYLITSVHFGGFLVHYFVFNKNSFIPLETQFSLIFE